MPAPSNHFFDHIDKFINIPSILLYASIMKNIEEIKSILRGQKDKLRKMYRVKEIGIFGSYIRGEQKEKSDLDVLVEFDEPVSLLWLVKVEIYLSELLGVKVDLVPKKDVRPELRERILKEAVYL